MCDEELETGGHVSTPLSVYITYMYTVTREPTPPLFTIVASELLYEARCIVEEYRTDCKHCYSDSVLSDSYNIRAALLIAFEPSFVPLHCNQP
jgi:hypothetical protein